MRHDIFLEKDIQIQEKIGEGAFGQVYKGQYKNEEVAIKLMQGAQIQETSIMESLKHQNIIEFYQYLKRGNCQYLIMEYAAGGSLKELMKKSLEESIISQIMQSIFTGVEYLHSKQIIHRDIKPDNILIKNSEDLSSIKIADFGLSYKYKPEIRYYQTVSEQCGTFIFMAPEQILNKSYNKAVDMWSCGIVFYMLLNQGQHPFYPRINTKKEFINSFPNLKYEQPLHASPLARDLLQRLLQFDQDSRYTASQALVHPWITRQFHDPIPMSLKQFGICQELKNQIFQQLQSILFIIQLQKLSIKQSPFQQKTQITQFKFSIAEFDEDQYEQQNLDTYSPRNQQFLNKLSITRPTKMFKTYRTLNCLSQKEKNCRLNAISNQTYECSQEFKFLKFQQQFSIDNEQIIIQFDPDSSKKNQKIIQSNKAILPTLTELTQPSLSPVKLNKIPIIKQKSFRKTESSFFLGLNIINNDYAQESKTQRIKTDIHDRDSIPSINTRRSIVKNNILNLVPSLNYKITNQNNLLIPKKII
ncbi:unnamed protein product [Paramecium sonneborni]|uniref:Protein kinase domain-containing protein n=1 Tax=Paramecium sonneborni TaxID=65129 RepID=A0A8S1LME0_9CILI|nr:unnamed protein product [Paramecium sonneborni]